MQINTMRRIDYFCGIPLCFLASIIIYCVERLMPKRQTPPQKVLFIELSEMGSAILADPALRKMRNAAAAQLYFLIFKSNAPSLNLLQTVEANHIFTIRADGLLNLALDTLKFLWWARQQRIDTVIDLELFSRYSALLTGLSGASNRVGFHAFHNEGLYRGHMLTRRVAYNPYLHIAKNFIALVNAALAPQAELPFSKTLIDDNEIKLAQAVVDNEAIAATRQRIISAYPNYNPQYHRIVLVNPNASDMLPQRRWMPEAFVTVMRSILAEDAQLLVLITGSDQERAEAQALKQQVNHERCINFAGCQRFEDLPALYQLSSVMLTNDSGPGHFSAVTALRTLVIFGPETPLLYGSLGNSKAIYAGLACSPCVSASNHRKTPCVDNVCLQALSPDLVLAELRAALREHSVQKSS